MEKETWKVGTHPSTVVSDKKIQNTNFPSPPNSRESEDDETEYYAWTKYWAKKAMELLEAGNREAWLAWNDTCLEEYRAAHNE